MGLCALNVLGDVLRVLSMFVAFRIQIRSFFSLELHKCPIFAILLWYCLQFKQTIHNVVIFVRKLKNSWIHCNGQTIYTVDLFLIERTRRFFFILFDLFVLFTVVVSVAQNFAHNVRKECPANSAFGDCDQFYARMLKWCFLLFLSGHWAHAFDF